MAFTSQDIPALTRNTPARSAMQRFRQRGGRGIRRAPGSMNGTETRYAAHLESLRIAGEIEWFAFEALTFKLAPDTRYTPDFVVMLPDLTIELHEVKGATKDKATGGKKPFIEEDAKLKIKVAAALMPFRFSIVYPIGVGQWGRKDFWEQDKPEPSAVSSHRVTGSLLPSLVDREALASARLDGETQCEPMGGAR